MVHPGTALEAVARFVPSHGQRSGQHGGRCVCNAQLGTGSARMCLPSQAMPTGGCRGAGVPNSSGGAVGHVDGLCSVVWVG